jgi:hypothetical protein
VKIFGKKNPIPLHTLSARHLIDDLIEDRATLPETSSPANPADVLRAAVVHLGEKYQLASRYTSFVAVYDETKVLPPLSADNEEATSVDDGSNASSITHNTVAESDSQHGSPSEFLRHSTVGAADEWMEELPEAEQLEQEEMGGSDIQGTWESASRLEEMAEEEEMSQKKEEETRRKEEEMLQMARMAETRQKKEEETRRMQEEETRRKEEEMLQMARMAETRQKKEEGTRRMQEEKIRQMTQMAEMSQKKEEETRRKEQEEMRRREEEMRRRKEMRRMSRGAKTVGEIQMGSNCAGDVEESEPGCCCKCVIM